MYRKFFEQNSIYLIYLLPLVLLLPFLDNAPLFDIDEGAFSEATREMLERNDYFSTWLNGNPRFDKPILIYWLQALSVSIFRINEWAFRLPSALATIGWYFVIINLAKENLGHTASAMAGVVFITCLGVQLIGRAATADALLNFFLALTLADLWRYIAFARTNAGRRAALWVALGILTKGPIAVLIPGAALILWSACSRYWQPLLRLIIMPSNWLILLVIALPWYIIVYAIHGMAFIQGFLIRHNLERFNGTLEGHSGSLFYYLLIVPLLVLPWLSWLISAIRQLPQSFHNPFKRFLWLWAGFVISFFSLSGTKLPHYALYGSTPLFILIAAEHERKFSRWSALPIIGLLLLYVNVPNLLSLITINNAFYAAQLSRIAEILPKSYLLVGSLLIISAVLSLMIRKMINWQYIGWLAIIGNVFIAIWLVPLIGELLQAPIRNAAQFAHEKNIQLVVQWQTHWPSFSVYFGKETPLRKPKLNEVALMRIDRLDTMINYEILFREGGIVLIKNNQP